MKSKVSTSTGHEEIKVNARYGPDAQQMLRWRDKRAVERRFYCRQSADI